MRKAIVFPFGFLTTNCRKTGIYKIVTPTGAVYIGRSRNVFIRLRDHALSRNPNYGLKQSIDLHGWNNHTFSILHELPNDVSDEFLDDYEEIYLEQFRETGHTILNEYSARQGKGRRMSEKAKQKIRDNKLGHKQSAETIAKRTAKVMGQKRKPHSEETKRKIAETLTGVKYTSERLDKVRENRKLVSNETKQKLSIKAKEQWAKQKGGIIL